MYDHPVKLNLSAKDARLLIAVCYESGSEFAMSIKKRIEEAQESVERGL